MFFAAFGGTCNFFVITSGSFMKRVCALVREFDGLF